LQAKLALWHIARRSWLVTFNVGDAGMLPGLQAAVVEKPQEA
jgi:hypothetical protein